MIDKIWEGYLFSEIDSIVRNKDVWNIYFHFGDQKKWRVSQVLVDSVPTQITKKNLGRIFSHYVNSGYPYATLTISNLRDLGTEVEADVWISKQVLIVYDSLEQLNSSSKIRDRFLFDALEMYPEDPFNERAFQRLESNIARHEFLLYRSHDVGFSNGKAKVYVDVMTQNVNKFEGIVGLLQNAQSDNILTGYLDLTLHNLFRSGKYLNFQWNRFNVQSQTLGLNYRHPYFLHSDLQLNFNLGLLKQDSSFFNRELGVSVSRYLGSWASIGFEYNQNVSSIIEEGGSLNPIPFTTNWYGMDIRSSKERIGQERLGEMTFHLTAKIGTRKVDDLISLDTLVRRSESYRIDGGLSKQFLLGESGAIFTQLSSGVIGNSQSLLPNELYRIGGLRSFRGLNENELFVKSYVKNKLEYRQYFEDRSYLLWFLDLGLVNSSEFSNIGNALASTGGGLILSTSNGQFNFIFAGAFSGERRFSINEIKVHFGYTSYF